VIFNIPAKARWEQNGVTVAGGHREYNALDQLYWPVDLFVHNDETVIFTDWANERIVQCNMNDENGQIIAGGNGTGNRLDQLNGPTNVLIDKSTNSLIICDRGNRRVVRWSCSCDINQVEILVSNIACRGLAMDDKGYLYIADYKKHVVKRYQIGDQNGTVVAGGNGKGVGLNQLNEPRYLFVDRQQAVYVSDSSNHRVMKWNKDAKEGIIVAGGRGKGNASTQLSFPYGLFVDALDTIYVADSSNNRVMRWRKGGKRGTIVVGGNDKGIEANQLNCPRGLSFDRHGNLYVVDYWNHRVQRFSIK
jgi:sugar lactone lactonase YvrE